MDFAQRICRSKAGNGCFLEATLVVVEVCVSLICKTAYISNSNFDFSYFGEY